MRSTSIKLIDFIRSFKGFCRKLTRSFLNYFSKYLPDSIKLPSDSDSREFFNPPVAYIFPSLVQVICRNVIDSNNFLSDCQSVYGNFTMILQALIYLLTIFINLKSIQKLLNLESYQVTMYFLLVSMLAVNYRTISMIRGETYILFFLSLLTYFLIDTHTLNFKVERKVYLIVGLLIALIALSRQWGFLLFPAFGILFFHPSISRSRNYFKFLLFSFSIGFVLSSWFYFSLYFEYGTFTAFNKDSLGFNFLNKPPTFYLPNTENLAAQSQSNRQGRGEVLQGEQAKKVLDLLKNDAEQTYNNYEMMLNERYDGSIINENAAGLARELARMNLTLNTYTQWYWKTDLLNLMNFLRLRADHHAQYEIRTYAEAMLDTLKKWVPITYEAFMDYRVGGTEVSAKGKIILQKLIKGEEVNVDQSGLSKREWNELMIAFGLKDKLI